jgi:DNA primase
MKITEQFVGFDALKHSVSMAQVLDRYGLLEQLHRSGDSLSGVCPIHSGHNPGQFRVSLSRNCWICFGDCHGGGSIVDFVSHKEGVGIREAALMIQNWFNVDTNSAHSCREAINSADCRPSAQSPSPPKSNRPLTFRLTGLDYDHPYLRSRGLSAETIGEFNLGYCTKGMLAGRIAIPIHDLQGRLVAYTGRWPGEPPNGIPKYRLPKGFRKSCELFNLHRAVALDGKQPLVVVEGFFGCMAVWQAGYRRVTALMGSVLSRTQEEMITKAAGDSGSVILLFDGDDAGRKGQTDAQERLGKHLSVHSIHLEYGQQPDSIAADALLGLILHCPEEGSES